MLLDATYLLCYIRGDGSLGQRSVAEREWTDSRRRTPHLKLFFISRSLAMTPTGSLSPVAFWMTGSSHLMKTLCSYSCQPSPPSGVGKTYLLVANGKLSSGDLILVRKLLNLLNGLALQHRSSEPHVGFGVLMAWVDDRVIR